MTDDIESLLVEVRAGTGGFERDIGVMRGAIDGTLVTGFERAGQVLERGLIGAIRRGSLGFDDLKRIALQAINEIAAQAAKMLIGNLFGGGNTSGGQPDPIGALLQGSLGAILGLPGRATGGPVAPGRGYLVGERGPELFVPTSAGRVEPLASPAVAERRTETQTSTQQPGAAPPRRIEPAPIQRPREVRVAIQVVSPPGASSAQSLQRSSRQVASAVRRALSGF